MKKLKWSVGKGELTVILFIGLLFGWLVTTMILSGTGNIKQFYDSGKIYDIDYEGRMQDFEGISYNVSEGRYNISGDTAVLYYNLRDSFQKWNHVYLTLKNVNQKSVATQIEYYLDGVLLETQNIVLTEGKNYINATGNIYNGMAIRIQNQQGTSFTVAKLQFREREQFLSGKKFSLIFFRR